MEAAADRKPIPRVAEVLGYVGGALALGAVISLVSAVWAQLGAIGHVALCAVVGAAGLGGGYAMGGSHGAAGARLRQFLLFVGVAGAGGTAGLAVYHGIKAGAASLWGSPASDWGWFAGCAAAAIAGGLVWWRERTWMQQVAFGLGVGLGSLMLLPLVPIDGPDWGAGAVLAAVGVVWGALSLRGRLDPANASLSLACLGVIGGIGLMAAGDFERDALRWALWLGLAVSLAMIGASIPTRLLVPLGFGAAGTAGFAFVLITDAFADTAGVPVALIATGLLFVVLAVVLALRRPRGGEAPPVEGRAIPVAAEALGYVGGSLMGGGIFAVMPAFWGDLGVWGRIAVPVAASAAMFVAGFMVGRLEGPAAKRLEQFLLGLGTIAAAGAVGIVAYEILAPRLAGNTMMAGRDLAGTWGNVAGMAALSVAGGLVWWRRPTLIQEALFGLGTLMLAGEGPAAVWITLGREPTQWQVASSGALTLLLGAAWLGLTLRGWTKPPNTGLAIGAIGVFLGIQNMARGPQGPNVWASWLGLAVFIGMVAASLWLKRGVLLGIGAFGTVVYAIDVVNTLFPGRIAGPISLLVAGVVLIVMAVTAVRVLPRWRHGGTAVPPGAPG